MDAETAFVHQFCNHVARMAKGYRDMTSWYVFSDKRPGSLLDRFNQDAADHAEYTKLFQP